MLMEVEILVEAVKLRMIMMKYIFSRWSTYIRLLQIASHVAMVKEMHKCLLGSYVGGSS